MQSVWISVTKVLAMDCEMVGAGLDGKRSILARVSLVCYAFKIYAVWKSVSGQVFCHIEVTFQDLDPFHICR